MNLILGPFNSLIRIYSLFGLSIQRSTHILLLSRLDSSCQVEGENLPQEENSFTCYEDRSSGAYNDGTHKQSVQKLQNRFSQPDTDYPTLLKNAFLYSLYITYLQFLSPIT